MTPLTYIQLRLAIGPRKSYIQNYIQPKIMLMRPFYQYAYKTWIFIRIKMTYLYFLHIIIDQSQPQFVEYKWSILTDQCVYMCINLLSKQYRIRMTLTLTRQLMWDCYNRTIKIWLVTELSPILTKSTQLLAYSKP